MTIFKKPRCLTSGKSIAYIFDIIYDGTPFYTSLNKEENINKDDILQHMIKDNSIRIQEISNQFCEYSSPYFLKKYSPDIFSSTVNHIIENNEEKIEENKFLSFIPHSIQIRDGVFYLQWTLIQQNISLKAENKLISDSGIIDEYNINQITEYSEEEPISLISKNKPYFYNKQKELKLRAKLLCMKAQRAMEVYESFKHNKGLSSDTSDESDDESA